MRLLLLPRDGKKKALKIKAGFQGHQSANMDQSPAAALRAYNRIGRTHFGTQCVTAGEILSAQMLRLPTEVCGESARGQVAHAPKTRQVPLHQKKLQTLPAIRKSHSMLGWSEEPAATKRRRRTYTRNNHALGG